VAPSAIRVETIRPTVVGLPYRATPSDDSLLRLTVSIGVRGEVMIEVDDTSVFVENAQGSFAIEQIDQLFVVERQPPAWCFLTWFGVFARRRGISDRLLVETPDGQVARFIERTIEERLGLRDEPVRGELRFAW
jgi:hypothetical protein